MPQLCRPCHHADRIAIDAALAAGDTASAVARRFGLSTDSLLRHSRNHLGPAVQLERQRLATVRVAGLEDRMEALARQVAMVLEGSLVSGKTAQALAAVREMRELLAQLPAARLADAELQRRELALDEEQVQQVFATVNSVLDEAVSTAVRPAARKFLAASFGALTGKDSGRVEEARVELRQAVADELKRLTAKPPRQRRPDTSRDRGQPNGRAVPVAPTSQHVPELRIVASGHPHKGWN